MSTERKETEHTSNSETLLATNIKNSITVSASESKPKNNNIIISNNNNSNGSISLGLSITDNKNTFALSSASKMGKKNKIPRGATGTMPPSQNNTIKNKKKHIIGFKQKKDDKKENVENIEIEKEYDVEVTEPPQYQLEELENIDDSKMHPRMRRDAPTTDMDMEHLTPEMDKQRRRESIVLDEDGDEYKQIQQEREKRIEIEGLRNECDIVNDNEKDDEYALNMDDLNILPNLSGLLRLETDPVIRNQDDTDTQQLH